MRAFVYEQYGTSEVLELKELNLPIPADNEIRIKIHAVSINSWDWDLLRGEPFIVRLAGGGISKPNKKIIGCDVSGVVDEAGKNVTRFKKGDAVVGDLSGENWGGFAEYVCGQEKSFVLKPTAISHTVAAAIPQAAVMALQGVRDYGRVKPGDEVLINGAGGGVGTFALQLAKLSGAVVTAVDHGGKADAMRTCGADHVIDFTREDCTTGNKRYDLILDVVGHHSLFDYRRILKPGGNYRMIGGPIGLIFASMLVAPLLSIFSSKKMGILAHHPNKGMDTLLELVENQKITPVIDKVFPFEQTREALTWFGTGSAKGKVVISVP